MSSPSHIEQWAEPQMGWLLPWVQCCLKPGGRGLRTLMRLRWCRLLSKHPCQACHTPLRKSAEQMQAGHTCKTCQTLPETVLAQLLCCCKNHLCWAKISGPRAREPQA